MSRIGRLAAALILVAVTLGYPVAATANGTPPDGGRTSRVDPDPGSSGTGSVRLMAVGDVMLGWQVGRKIVNKGPGAPWKYVKSYFDRADLVVANLECVISDRGKKWPTKLIHLRAPKSAAASLVAGGVDVVSVANNHALDFGPDAFGDTLGALRARGIAYAGGGADANAASAPAIVQRAGLRIAFLGYVLPFSSKRSFSTRHWAATATKAGLAIGTPEAVRRDVKAARSKADLVVVMVHGGAEYRTKPIARQRKFARAAVEAGATLVLGHHPHVLHGYARSGNSLVAFSLGNFMFARFHGKANDSAILDVTLNANGVQSIAWIPVIIKGGIPRPATGTDRTRILKRLPQLKL